MAKIKDEQLAKINELKGKFNELTFLIGKNKIEQISLKAEEEAMISEYARLGEEEQNFLGEIQKEYGDGNLDTNTGEFTPTNTK
jgi:hypothetical protein